MAESNTLPKSKARPATYADIEALPENMVGEILFGVLHTHGRPTPRHGRAAWRLSGQLDGPFDRGTSGPGGWIFMPEAELQLDEHVIVPDNSGWRRERLPQLPDAAFVDVPPDWVCEILSPSTARIDRTDKLAIYAEFGVGHAWYLDPIAKTLEVMTLVDGKWLISLTFKDDATVTAPPFEAHTFSLDVLWPNDTLSEPPS